VKEAYCEHGDAEGEERAADCGSDLGRRAGFGHGVPPERHLIVAVPCSRK
jgi:hypothetical protein